MSAKTAEIQVGIGSGNTRVTRPPPPSNTRVTSGPPPKGPHISNEGPAQPALRRFGVRSEMERPHSNPPPGLEAIVRFLGGRFAAPRHLGQRQQEHR
jgi:hypothetical protein